MKQENTNRSIEDKIKNRSNILKWIMIFMVLIGFGTLILLNKIKIDLTSIEFSDVLTLVISLWAIYISMQFYFSSQRSSISFYDNVYNFIQDISKNLANLDGSVNEKLNGLNDTFKGEIGRLKEPKNNSKDAIELSKKEKQLKSEISETKKELEKTISELAKEKNNSKVLKKKLYTINEELVKKEVQSNELSRKIKYNTRMEKIYYFYNDIINKIPQKYLNIIFREFRSQNAKELFNLLRKYFTRQEFLEYSHQNLIDNKREYISKEVFHRLYELYNI